MDRSASKPAALSRPSFETVRWLGAHATLPILGADDAASRHVSEWVTEWVMERIVGRFKRHRFDAPAPVAAPGPRFY